MKEDLSFLNDIDIDENEIEEKELDEITMNKIKKSVKKEIRKNKFKRNNIVAASILAGVICATGIVGVVNPAYAANIPIISDIFRFIDEKYGNTGAYDKYKENASEINITKESNGIEITIKDAVFDGKNINYTYELKSDRNLGDYPLVGCDLDHIKIEGYYGSLGGGSSCERVHDNTYVGSNSFSIDEEMKEINLKLNFSSIRINEKNNDEEINGEWNFDLNLKATENTKQVVNKTIEKDGIEIIIDNIIKTPMSTAIEYTQEGYPAELEEKWHFIRPFIEVSDDLGNVYEFTDCSGDGENGTMHYSANFGSIDENATKLIITPKLDLGNEGKVEKRDENGQIVESTSSIDENHPRHGEIIFDSITVDLKK